MSKIINIPLDELEVSPLNPRFDRGDIETLVKSIETNGILNPLVVREKEGRKEVVFGGRRLMAAGEVGLEEAPCRIEELTDEEVVEHNLIDNEIRESLKPIERAEAIKYLINNGQSIPELEGKISLGKRQIKKLLELFEVPEDIRERTGDDGLTLSHVLIMKENIRQPEGWDEWSDRVEEEDISAKQLEKLIRESWSEEDEEEYVQEQFNRRPVFITLTPDELVEAIDEKKLVTERQVFKGQNISVSAKIKGKVLGYERVSGNKYEVEFE